jgi:hypothetical protein
LSQLPGNTEVEPGRDQTGQKLVGSVGYADFLEGPLGEPRHGFLATLMNPVSIFHFPSIFHLRNLKNIEKPPFPAF